MCRAPIQLAFGPSPDTAEAPECPLAWLPLLSTDTRIVSPCTPTTGSTAPTANIAAAAVTIPTHLLRVMLHPDCFRQAIANRS
jgi:hypothetical protein